MEKLLLIISASLLLISCSDKVSQSDLSGTYKWNNSQKGNLIINNDFTYLYKFDLVLDDSIKNIGTWEFDSTLQEIRFHNFAFTREEVKGIWISRVRMRNEEIQLIYASDSDIYLKKYE